MRASRARRRRGGRRSSWSSARRVELEPLLTEVVPLAEWERAFAATRAAEGIKFVLDPQTM